ncbi:hypothetical protein MPSEU_000514400 [Mayamaea pseudoterrestris]|nr:hypothetical protein MPSEU_000514400 [Mayamaea pseudoterrestris]
MTDDTIQLDGDCEMTLLQEIVVVEGPLKEEARRKRSKLSCVEATTNAMDVLPYELEEPSYYNLLRDNLSFRLFFASYTASHLGEWLTYLASIAALEHANDDPQGLKKTMIGVLIIVRLLPNVILAPFGGVLADGRDRRQSMVALDIAGAFVGGIFIFAMRQKSVLLIYVATFVQQCLAGLYEPCRSAIVPLLVSNENDLKMAVTINGLTWSLVAAIGSSLGGVLVSSLGLQACFFIDSFTYMISALLMYRIPGAFTFAEDNGASIRLTPAALWRQVKDMLIIGVHYVCTSFFGALVLVKASAAVVYGGCDILNVSFSERGDPEGMSSRLGVLFGFVGVGCLVGPLMFDPFTDMENPKGLQVACILAMALTSFGAVLMGACHRYFWMTCIFTAVRSAGSSVLWINSSLLLQKFTDAELFGRVTSIDYSLALLSEAISAYAAGAILDQSELQPEEVSVKLGIVGCFFTSCWVFYHFAGGGAAGYVVICGDRDEKAAASSTEVSVASELSHLMDDDDAGGSVCRGW